MQAAVGDFVVAGQHVIAVFSEGHVPAQASRQLQRMVALGVERTMEQDPAFAIRIMADMAVKALSAAINDPHHHRRSGTPPPGERAPPPWLHAAARTANVP